MRRKEVNDLKWLCTFPELGNSKEIISVSELHPFVFTTSHPATIERTLSAYLSGSLFWRHFMSLQFTVR
jgi:hypothetical protein